MVNTHEIKLGVVDFEGIKTNNYIILKKNDIEVNDFILFKQVSGTVEEGQETGLFMMIQVTNMIENEGLKEGYALLMFNRL